MRVRRPKIIIFVNTIIFCLLKNHDVLAANQANAAEGSLTFQYVKLFLETLTSPQIIIFLIILVIVVKRPKILERIAMLDIAGVKLQLTELKESVEESKSGISQLEAKLETIKKEYITSSTTFNPLASTEDIDKLANYLKTVADSLENIDFVLDYLNKEASQGEIFAVACAIQVRPEAKFPDPNFLC